jgi:hypothetical protein
MARYYGANTTRILSCPDLSSGYADSQDSNQAIPAYTDTASRRAGGEDQSQDQDGAQTLQVEAVIKMLKPGFNVRIIAPKRRR